MHIDGIKRDAKSDMCDFISEYSRRTEVSNDEFKSGTAKLDSSSFLVSSKPHQKSYLGII
jgi:hypothetical protein